MLDELEWPSLEAVGIGPLCFFLKRFTVCVVSIEKDKYLTPALNSKVTRSSSHCDTRQKNSFFPQTIPRLNSLSPSAVATQIT